MSLLHSHTQTPGRKAPAFFLPGVDGRIWTLDDVADKQGVAVIFTCNHCPYAVASRPVITDLAKKYPDIGFVCISSNDAQSYPDDSFEKMKELSEKLKLDELKIPYLYDEDQTVAKAYDAQCTPDNYLFRRVVTKASQQFEDDDIHRELFFHGRFTDNRQDPSAVQERNFEEHIQKLLAGEDASDIWPTSMGCSIKWK